MPHVIAVDGSRTALRGVVDVGRNGGPPLLRFHPYGSGDLAVFAPAGARVDGVPIVGGVAVVDWGAGAVVRALDLRVEIRFEHARASRRAGASTRCTLCFDAVPAGTTIVACYCQSAVHADCASVMISCASCGEPAA